MGAEVLYAGNAEDYYRVKIQLYLDEHRAEDPEENPVYWIEYNVSEDLIRKLTDEDLAEIEKVKVERAIKEDRAARALRVQFRQLQLLQELIKTKASEKLANEFLNCEECKGKGKIYDRFSWKKGNFGKIYKECTSCRGNGNAIGTVERILTNTKAGTFEGVQTCNHERAKVDI